MDKSTKILVSIIGVMLLIIGYQQKKISDTKSQLTQVITQKDLGGGTTRSSVHNGTVEDVMNAAADAGMSISAVKDDAESHGASITGANVSVARTDGSTHSDVSSSRTAKRQRGNETSVNPHDSTSASNTQGGNTSSEAKQDPTTCGPNASTEKCPYNDDEQILDVYEQIGDQKIAFGNVSFKAWELKPWSLTVLPREYRSTVIFAETDDGQKIAYSHNSITVGDTTVNLPISSSKFITSPKPAKFRLSPRLHLSVSLGLTLPLFLDGQFGAKVHFFNYGSDKLMPDFTFAGVGLGYSAGQSSMVFGFTPALYRVGKHLPLVEDLYIGPEVTVSLSGSFSILLSLSTAL